MNATAPTVEPSEETVAPEDRLQRARDRLAVSRQRLLITWAPRSEEDIARGARAQRRVGSWLRYWRHRARGIPVVGLAVDGIATWWENNPWRVAGQALAAELDDAVKPWVRRHPVLTIGVAAGLGYAVVASRAWTWPALAEQIRPLPSRAGRWLLHQLTQAPLQTLLASLALMRGSEPPAPASPEVPSPAAGLHPHAAGRTHPEESQT